MIKKQLQIISHSFPNHIAPYDATFVSDHADALSDEFEIDVTVPTPRSLPFTTRYLKNHSDLLLPEKVTGERCYYLSLPNRKSPLLIRNSLSKRLIISLKDRLPDLVHIHFLYPSGLAIPALKKALHCPLALTIHGVDFYHTIKKPRLKELLRDSLYTADVIIAVGPQLFKDILHHFPELELKLQTIHNYVDTSSFYSVSNDKKLNLKKELRLSNERFQLLCVANFRYKKGIDLLVEAIGMLKDQAEIDLHLIGRLNEEPEFEASVLSKIKKNRLQNFHIHGPMPRIRIQKWMQAVDGFILPSRNEPFGISLIEAMSCGLPVISTKSGGPEVILTENWGRLVKPDSSQLADAIKSMIELKYFDAKGQQKYIKETFGKTRYIEDHKKLYGSLM